MLTITMRDEAFRPRGQIRATSLTAVLRLNAPASYTFDAHPEDLEKTSRIKKGWGLIIQDEDLRISGPITSQTLKKDKGLSERTYVGTSDLALLSDRVTYPNPKAKPGSQDTAYYKQTGPAETLIKQLITANAGAEALPERRIPALTVASDRARGPRSSINTRLKDVLQEAAALAKASGLVLDCAQAPDSASTVFEVSEVADKSRRIRLTARSDELIEYTVALTAPTATAVIVGGPGEGADRQLQEHTQENPWGARRIEVFKDRRDTQEASELTKAAQEQLADSAEKTKLTFTVHDSPYRKFGRDYGLGDVITVELDTGAIFTEQITSATVTWENNAREVTLTVGNTDDDLVTSEERKKIRELAQQVAALEAI